MSLVINTNVSSLNAQNNLNKSQGALSSATQRLSSGLKINSAADNAAGFAISTRFQTQIGGLAQAGNNASDAINLAQTAGSALDQVTSNLQSIRDLAVQAANGTYTDSDRQAIDTEVQQRLQEITRIANQTSFNGRNILNGSVTGGLSFQIGANVGQTISVDLGSGVTAGQIGQTAEISTDSLTGAVSGTNGLDLSSLSITGSDGKNYTVSGTAHSVQDIADAINAAGAAGVSASVNANGGINIYSSGSLSVSGTAAQNTALFAAASGSDGTAYTAGGTAAVSGSLQGQDVKTVDDANKLIASIDGALSSVSNISSTLGAVQNRFQSTIATLSAQSTNLQASQSSIQDADFAQETANLSKAQVLQQAGISVLATANSQPQNVLRLLQ
ncbi:flagellin [Frateuria defendens]|uniref:flagellin N-terminal helical domain-containing protein n=1 Tax=Frateuria defendens TaxID=2219559 RepID=UPI00066FCF33|nr:flagellin [Frateuria defendens]